MPVRNASAKKTLVNNSTELANDPSFTQALGLLLFGNDNCEEEVEEELVPVEEEKHFEKPMKKPKPVKEPKPQGSFKDKIGNMLGRLFEDGGDESDEN